MRFDTVRFGKPAMIRAAKRLNEASGYLDLGLTQRAVACLDGLGDPGPFAVAVEVLRGEVARREQRFGDAADSLEAAARLLPSPSNKTLWLAVSHYHRQAGNLDHAIETLANARGALPRE